MYRQGHTANSVAHMSSILDFLKPATTYFFPCSYFPSYSMGLLLSPFPFGRIVSFEAPVTLGVFFPSLLLGKHSVFKAHLCYLLSECLLTKQVCGSAPSFASLLLFPVGSQVQGLCFHFLLFLRLARCLTNCLVEQFSQNYIFRVKRADVLVFM